MSNDPKNDTKMAHDTKKIYVVFETIIKKVFAFKTLISKITQNIDFNIILNKSFPVLVTNLYRYLI